MPRAVFAEVPSLNPAGVADCHSADKRFMSSDAILVTVEMDSERVIEFNCPLKMKLVLPKDCIINEDDLKKRIETAGPQLFKGFCDACPHFREKK